MPYGYMPGYYGMRGGGYLPQTQFQPINLGQLMEEQQQISAAQTLQPLEVAAQRQQIEQGMDQSQRQYGEQSLADVARQTQALDPQDRASYWDQQMRDLASKGVGQASQYVGRYRDDLGQRVMDAYGAGAPAGRGGAAATSSPAQQYAIAQAVGKMTPLQMADSLHKMNLAINTFNGVKDEQGWNNALDTLRRAGIPIDQWIPSADWASGMGYRQAYNLLNEKVLPMRDAIASRLAVSSMGAVPPEAASPYAGKGATQYIGTDPATGNALVKEPDGTIVNTGQRVAAKPSSAQGLFDMKRQAAEEIGWSPEDALAFAGGKRKPSDGELQEMSRNAAIREYSALSLNSTTPISNPEEWINQRAGQFYQQLTQAGAGSQSRPAASPEAIPARAVALVKAAGGKPFRFANGQVYRWANGKAVRVQ